MEDKWESIVLLPLSHLIFSRLFSSIYQRKKDEEETYFYSCKESGWQLAAQLCLGVYSLNHNNSIQSPDEL